MKQERDAVTEPELRPVRYHCKAKGKLAPFQYRIHRADCGATLFVGLDVSLWKTAIYVISENGQIVKEAQVTSEPEALLHWISDQDGTIAAVGLEAGPLSQWLHRGLPEAGQLAVLIETWHLKGALKAMPVKTDLHEAEGIARFLHVGWFWPAHHKLVSA